MKRALLLASLLCLAAPASAWAESVGVGVAQGASVRRVAHRIESITGRAVSTLLPGTALQAEPAGPAQLRRLGRIPGVDYVESLDVKRRLAFATNDPLAAKQWYLAADKAFDFWTAFPQLAAVKVAIIDSGLDCGHPEFPPGRVAAVKSFVGSSACVDTDGHGTFVAGEIAAADDNGQGIAGIGLSAQLLIAKVVDASGNLPLRAEVEAIRWAADQGARVINLSLGGVRDPLDPSIDTYSPLEQAAVDYAVRKGAVVVAAVGNGPQSPRTPWPYAGYPAALPHVLGVSAVTQTGAVPAFSNRDSVYNDIAAPGEAIVSTVPRTMTADRPTCVDQGYSPCGTQEFRDAIGTSFAAPQVSAAAALVLSVRGDLHPDQVTALLERTADDANPSTGCAQCPLLRDGYTGWGTLDILKALEVATSGGPLPPPDRYETNDEAGAWAYTLWGRRGRTIHATLDYWDDQLDVYAVPLRKGQRIFANLSGPPGAQVTMMLWKPGTRKIEGVVPLTERAALAARRGRQERFAYTARRSGKYFISLKLLTQTQKPYAYTLAFAKRPIS